MEQLSQIGFTVPCFQHISFDFLNNDLGNECTVQLKQRLLSSIKLSTRIRCHIKMSVSVFLLSKFRVKNHAIVIPFSIFPLWCKYFLCHLICFDNGGFSF